MKTKNETCKLADYRAFWGLLRQIPTSDADELKVQLVWEYSNCRTTSLREMTGAEYGNMLRKMRSLAPDDRELRRKRSAVLKQMQIMGINTTDWRMVNKYCSDKRIAGKAFARLNEGDLSALYRKLKAIQSKR